MPIACQLEARFEPCTSPYPLPDGVPVECGYLVVPESRSAASGGEPFTRTLRLFVAIVPAQEEPRQPDPVVWLNGGPGGNSGWVLSPHNLARVRDVFGANRDLIVFDQRGTGHSQPALHCPETAEAEVAALLEGLDPDARRAGYLAAALRCRERLAAEGVNLAAFNTVESAADIEDLRLALGYPALNLYGISYGTRLALAAMRDVSHCIRSVILDSTVPMQVSQYGEGIANTAGAFELLFSQVEADPAANAIYPHLRRRFYDLLTHLNARPDILELSHPISGDPLSIPITGELLAGLLCGMFYDTALIPTLPAVIDGFLRGDYSPVGTFVIDLLTPSRGVPYAEGMYWCVNCCDDKVTPALTEQIAQQARDYPAMAALPFMEFHLGEYVVPLCAGWDARECGPAEYAPVESDLPTLILAGEFDQNTPAHWGRLAAETLANSSVVVFPGVGHGVMLASDCAGALVRAFIEDPTARLDTTCVVQMSGPRWVVAPAPGV